VHAVLSSDGTSVETNEDGDCGDTGDICAMCVSVDTGAHLSISRSVFMDSLTMSLGIVGAFVFVLCFMTMSVVSVSSSVLNLCT